MPPSEAVQRILYQAEYFFRVQYLQGSPLSNTDLVRAKASEAQAILFMTNKFSSDPNKEDARTIMQLFSVRRYLESVHIHDTFLCVQVILPENVRKLDAEQTVETSTVCLNKMRMGVIAKSCIYPGTSTLLFNLLNSFAYAVPSGEGSDQGEGEGEGQGYTFKDHNKTHQEKEKKSSPTQKSATAHQQFHSYDDEEDTFMDWDAEYKLGAGWEIYTTEIAGRFSGYPFMDIARVFYDRLGVVLFALKVKDLKGRRGTRLLLNPAEYIIPSRLDCLVEGFVIAEDNTSADLSFMPKLKSQSRRGSQVGSFVSAISSSVEKGKNFIRRKTGTLDTGGSEQKHVSSSFSADAQKNLILQARKKLVRQNSSDLALNAQEKRQQRKDNAFRENFYVARKPIDLEYVTVKTSILEEFSLVHDHIIVTGKSLNNLVDFILPLRERKKGSLRHIVILHTEDIPYHIWGQISMFEGVFFVRGSPISERDLQRAGVFRASHFVLLAGEHVSHGGKERGGGDSSTASISGGELDDADAIFSYQIIRRMNEELNIVIEMVNNIFTNSPGYR